MRKKRDNHGRDASLRNLWMTLQADEQAGARLKQIIEKNKMKDKRIISTAFNSAKIILFWMVFCFIGNVYQVYQISSQYFMFGITTNLQLVVEDVIEVPSITLCVELAVVMKWDQLTHDERFDILGTTHFLGFHLDEETNETISEISTKLSDTSNLILTIIVTSKIHGTLSVRRIFNTSYGYKKLLLGAALYVDKFEKTEAGYISLDHTRGKLMDGRQKYKYERLLKVTSFLRDIMRCFNFEVKPKFRKVS